VHLVGFIIRRSLL